MLKNEECIDNRCSKTFFEEQKENDNSEDILDGFGVPFDKETCLKHSIKSKARILSARGYHRLVTLVLTNRELYIYENLKHNRNHKRMVILGPDFGYTVKMLPEIK